MTELVENMEPDLIPVSAPILNGEGDQDEFGKNLIRIRVTDQIKELQTVLRDK